MRQGSRTLKATGMTDDDVSPREIVRRAHSQRDDPHLKCSYASNRLPITVPLSSVPVFP